MMQRASCGLDVNFPIEVGYALKSAFKEGYEFICLPLVHPRYKREFIKACKERSGAFTRPDLVLKSNEWNTLIAAKISPYIDVKVEAVLDQGKLFLEQELNYGNHLDIPAIIISLKSSKCSNFARIINSNLSGHKPHQIWVEVPLISPREEASVWRSDSAEHHIKCTWKWWNIFRTFCNYDKRLGVILRITKKLPPEKEISRWIGEPLKCLVIPTHIFLTNKIGYPVLSRAHQTLIKSFVSLDIQVIITGNNHHSNFGCYQKYIDHLWQNASKQNTPKNVSHTENFVQCPLQPLSDNLISKTYKLFAKDIVKYNVYAKAIHSALVDLHKSDNTTSNVINVMVVGAGKGLLVAATLNAAEKAGKKVKIIAVEKNPGSIMTLQTYKEDMWKDVVEVISGDITELNFPSIIDILVSELLGSFGDNKLAPELLDKAQKFLKEDGISIPQSYTSYLCPVQLSKVYSDLKGNKDNSNCETPYVVSHKNKYNISKAKPLFKFHHPNHDEVRNNNFRYKSLVFYIKQNCVLHGFMGFFETVLYRNITLSVVPETHTPNLISWNPIFFPLMEPVQINSGDEIEVHFWRLVGKTNVWYEWALTKPIPLPIHNTNGHSSSISLM